MSNQTTRLHAVVAEHTADIEVIKSELGTLRASTISNGQKLDKLFEIMQKRAGNTVEDLSRWLQVAVLGGALVGGIVSGIVYIASNISASDLAVLQYRMDRVYGSFEWEPKVVREGGG